MALTPEVEEDVLLDEESTPEPSRTWSIDFDGGRIGGAIDGELALRQFVIKALMTERDRYVIYTEDYGNELYSLIGEDMTDALLGSEVPRMVEEALLYDERVEVVEAEFRRDGDKLFINVKVTAVSGEQITEEVVANV